MTTKWRSWDLRAKLIKAYIACLIVVVICYASAFVDQSSPSPESSMTVFVTDKGGHPVADLTMAELQYKGGRQPITITQLKGLADTPLLLCILIDESNS